MLCGWLKVTVKFDLGAKAKQACQAYELMTNGIIILEVVLEPPLIVERAQAQVAAHFMAPRVLYVILETVSILEYALAQIAVVLVIWCWLLDMIE
jgi:hypothetical protein